MSDLDRAIKAMRTVLRPFVPPNDETLARALTAAAPFLTQIPDGCLNVGHQVVKTKGYPFPGEVRAVFKTRAGFVRYVVEATGEDYRGMLHIFDATQLALPPPPQERTDG